MKARGERAATALAITILLFTLLLTNVQTTFADDYSGKIDLFTQKEPYSGKGLNVTSDAFGPGEEVQVFASVTYQDYPVQSLLVAFEFTGPPNPIKNMTFSRVAFTNETGIAKTSFRISHLNETTFGRWTVIGNTKIDDTTFTDKLTFKVGWIVEIISTKTVNKSHFEQEEFAIMNYVGIELTLKNIAMTEKTTNVSVVIYDCFDVPVNSTELTNLIVPPNEALLVTYSFLYIPETTHIGIATAYASAYITLSETEQIPYCPEVSKTFLVVGHQYFLKVRSEPTDIITIPGEGWYYENANISLTAPNIAPFTAGVRYRFYYWDVDGKSQGIGIDTIVVLMDVNHTATAHYILQYYLTVNSLYGISTGEGWYDAGLTAYATLNIALLDHGNGTRRAFANWSEDSSGTNFAQSNPVLMDRPKTAIAKWKTQYYLSLRTDPSGITTIAGEGWYDKSTNATIVAPTVFAYRFEYWDIDNVVRNYGTDSITILMNTSHTATAHYTPLILYMLTITTTWGGTTNPAPGTYNYIAGTAVQVTALPSDGYTFSHWELDNMDVGTTNPYILTMNKSYTLKAVFSRTPAGWFVPDWVYWFLIPLFALIIILLIAWFILRRRRKEAKQTFYSGWTAWYYGYDLRKGKSPESFNKTSRRSIRGRRI